MKRLNYLSALLTMTLVLIATFAASAQKSKELDKNVDKAFEQLLATSPAAKSLSTGARGILMFPSVKKAGFLVGGQYGEGALRVGGKTAGYYNTSAASFGLQAGGQKFGYAMFFMNDNALEYL